MHATGFEKAEARSSSLLTVFGAQLSLDLAVSRPHKPKTGPKTEPAPRPAR